MSAPTSSTSGNIPFDSVTSVEDAAIRLENVSKVFHQGEPTTILNDISFEIPSGSYTALMGPSGAGKSTLLNIIGCLSAPTTGCVYLNGQEVATLSEQERTEIRRNELGFIFQSFYLIPNQSALRNVVLPMVFNGISQHSRQERAVSLLERVGLGDRTEYTPEELSAGQRQRVAIARALANEPTILLADEPTGSLDSATGETILDLFDELHDEGQTILVVTHDNNVAERADRTIWLADGSIGFNQVGSSNGCQ